MQMRIRRRFYRGGGMHFLEQADRRDPVHRRVMQFQVHGEGAPRQSGDIVQALDDVDLPQGAVPVQGPRMQPCHLYHQLPPVARGGQCEVANMVFHVDRAARDPVGPVQTQGRAGQVVAEYRVQVQALREMPEDFLVANPAAGGSARVVDNQRPHMVVDVAPLREQRGVVQPG